MADPDPTPEVLRRLMTKAGRGEVLGSEEFQRLQAYLLLKITAELEHICAALSADQEPEVLHGG
jgi:hypothetical protein